MPESWMTPSDIAQKLSSHVSSSFLLPVKVRGTVIVDKQRGYYRLSDGKAGITLNVPPSVDLPIGAEVEIDGVLIANSFVKEDVAFIYPAINVNSYRVLDEEFPSVWTSVHTYRPFWATRRGLRAFESPGRTLTPHNLSERLANALRAYFFGGLLSFPTWDMNKYNPPHLVVKEKKLDAWLYKITRFRSAAGKYADRVKFVRFESSLVDRELAKTIEETSKAGVHAVFLLRGGGSQEELARIGGFESILAVIRLNIPFYTAIGHSFDRMVSLIEKVADGHFPTPSIAGQELGKLVYTFSELENLKQKITKPSLVWWLGLLAAGLALLFILWRIAR
jgi:hypothetical protein